MTRPRHLLAILLLSLALCDSCVAGSQVEVTFPLQGYYRPGRFIPVRIETDSTGDAPVVLGADGALTLSVALRGGGVDAVFPWLAVDTIREPQWSIRGEGSGPVDVKLTPVEANQALVGVAGVDPDAGAELTSPLFPGWTVVPVILAGTPALPGDPLAWESLDAIVFGQSPGEVILTDLVASGIAVVITSDAAPGGPRDWQGGPGRWFIAFPVAGPRGAIHPEVYEPTHAWRPGWPGPLRRRAVLLAIVFAIVALAATLWLRSWSAAIAVTVASVAAAGGFAWWGARQPMLRVAHGVVRVAGDRAAQNDLWTYLRPLRSREVSVNWESGKPVFGSERHASETDLTLRCAASGRPLGYTWPANSGTTLAFLSRAFNPGAPPPGVPASGPPSSTMGELVRQAYLSPGDVIREDAGDKASAADVGWSNVWPAVTIRRASR